jgi:hypothetical protein
LQNIRLDLLTPEPRRRLWPFTKQLKSESSAKAAIFATAPTMADPFAVRNTLTKESDSDELYYERRDDEDEND